jgi:hypothetical protein
MKAVKIRQVRQLLIIKLVQFHGGLTALNTAIREEFIAIREEFILKKLSISIDFIIT